jgi:hypothetical protein
MKALVKRKSEPGLWMEDVPTPKIGDNDLLIKVKKNSHMRHRCPYLEMGYLGAAHHSSGTDYRA